MPALSLKLDPEFQKRKIEELLARHDLMDAIEQTLDFPQAFFGNDTTAFKDFRASAVSISARYNRNIKDRRILTREQGEVSEDKIIGDLTDLLHEMCASATRSAHKPAQVNNPGAAPDPATMTGNIIELSNVRKSFGSANFLLGPITLKIEHGEVLALMGANASGKSTLLRVILGELAASSGSVIYPGLPRARSYRNLRSTIGYVPQFPTAWQGSLRENLHYYLAARGVRGEENQERVEYYLHRFRLTRFQHQSWSEISGGYKLRFALARELLTEPSLLILDEPLAHLDIESQSELLDLMKSISQRTLRPVTVVLTSQHIYETERFCSNVVILNDGKLVAHGKLSNLYEILRKTTFEIEASTPIDIIRSALESSSYRVIGRLPVLLVEAPVGSTMKDLVERLVMQDIEFKSIRDVSSSSRIHFQSSQS